MKKKKYNELKANDLESVAGGELPYTAADVQKKLNDVARILELIKGDKNLATRGLVLKRAAKLSKEAKEMSDNLLKEKILSEWEILN